jgi:hypothetical protein
MPCPAPTGRAACGCLLTFGHPTPSAHVCPFRFSSFLWSIQLGIRNWLRSTFRRRDPTPAPPVRHGVTVAMLDGAPFHSGLPMTSFGIGAFYSGLPMTTFGAGESTNIPVAYPQRPQVLDDTGVEEVNKQWKSKMLSMNSIYTYIIHIYRETSV